MISDKQLIANKTNALKAGVKTAEGKAAVKHNAVKHGLRANTFLKLPELTEHPEDYQRLLEAMHAELKPVGPLEAHFVAEIATVCFKRQRYELAEAAAFQSKEDLFDLDPAFKPNNSIELVQRYKARLDNSLQKSLKSLAFLKHSKKMDLFGSYGGSCD